MTKLKTHFSQFTTDKITFHRPTIVTLIYCSCFMKYDKMLLFIINDNIFLRRLMYKHKMTEGNINFIILIKMTVCCFTLNNEI